MTDAALLPELVHESALRAPDATALTFGSASLTYGELSTQVSQFASGLMAIGVARSERVGIYLDKRSETVIAAFGSGAAGAVFVPLNPLLKPEQVGYILRDCGVRALVTSPERWALLAESAANCPALRHVVLAPVAADTATASPEVSIRGWDELVAASPRAGHRVIDADMAAILYTSGSTGKPKGVVLSHRNMVAGAKSVASYLGNDSDDTLLAALPLSFDAGFSQLTTAFHAGARVVLINYLLPRDVVNALAKERVTGLTGVPLISSARQWPESIGEHLRYFANTGGRTARSNALRRAPRATVPMYGLTEGSARRISTRRSRSTARFDRQGHTNAEILVLREDGSACAPNEPGELVHRGALVASYWNDREDRWRYGRCRGASWSRHS